MNSISAMPPPVGLVPVAAPRAAEGPPSARATPAFLPVVTLPDGPPEAAGDPSAATDPGGRAVPPGGNDLPPLATWLPLQVPVVAADLARAPARGGGSAPGAGNAPTEPTPARPGRGPEVPVQILGRELPVQVMARLAEKSGPPGQGSAAPLPPGPPAGVPQPVPGSPTLPLPPPGPGPMPPPLVPKTPLDPIPIDDPVPEPTFAANRVASDRVVAGLREPPAHPRPPGAPAPLPASGPVTSAEMTDMVPTTAQTAVQADAADALPVEARPATPSAATALPQAATPREPAAPAVMQLPEPVGSERFGQSLGERVVSLVDRHLASAQFKLNPPQLGPLEVRVNVSGDQASVSFTTHSYLTRDALEQALPRLRDMLGAQGFAQVDVNVSQHSFSERPGRSDPWEPSTVPVGTTADAPSTPVMRSARASVALLDAYA